MLAVILVLNFSCSTDTTDFTEEENSLLETKNTQSKLGQISQPCDVTKLVYAQYEFTVYINGQQIIIPAQSQAQMKINFQLEMSQHFTICEVNTTDCPEIDAWVVSAAQYNNYVNSNPNYGSGTNGKIIEEDEDGWQDESGVPNCERR